MLRTRLFTTATSLDLSGIITDETGTGSLVFNTNPTIISPTINTSLVSNGFVQITDATASTSTTTGALTVAGGVGIGGALNVGSDAVINGVKVGRGTTASPNTNTVVGSLAGDAQSASSFSNTLIGRNAGTAITDGNRITCVGDGAGASATSANQATYIGWNTGNLATGSSNTAVGREAMIGLSTIANGGINNTAVGSSALRDFGSASNCVAIGVSALLRNQISDIVAIGAQALDDSTLGTANVAVGRSALGAATTAIATVTTTDAGTLGTDGLKTPVQLERDSGGTMVTYPTVELTVASGSVSGTVTVLTGGSGSTSSTAGGIIFRANAAGIAAGVPADWRCQLQTVATASSNTAVGHQAGLSLTTATECTLIGTTAGDAITTGSQCTALGSRALTALTSGVKNTALGMRALENSITGICNTAIGFRASGNANVTGRGNVAVGANSLAALTSGNHNIGIAGANDDIEGAAGSSITTGSNNICIGRGANVAAGGDSNSIVIGHTQVADGSNTTVIGNTSTTSTRIPAGNLTLSNGNLILGTAGNGIDFSATGNVSGPAIAAEGWFDRTATNVSDGDTVTIGTTVYTFKTTLTPADWEVLIGVDAAASLTNLRNAILGTGGTPGTDYQVPNAHPTVTAERISGTRLPLRAITAGAAGNSIALAETSAQLSRSNATLVLGSDATGTTSELLDDYEVGTWTPSLTLSAPGDLVVTYLARRGWYTKVGRMVTVWCEVVTSTWTHTTASGAFRLTGLPFTVASYTTTGFRSGAQSAALTAFSGINTTAGRINYSVWTTHNTTNCGFGCSANNGPYAFTFQAADVPTTNPVSVQFAMSYLAA